MSFGSILVPVLLFANDPRPAAPQGPLERDVESPGELAPEHDDAWTERWHPLDDPNAEELPDALGLLTHAGRAAFEADGEASLLLVRRLTEAPSLIDAFMDDEEVMSQHGDFIPLEDRPVELPYGEGGESGEEGFAFDCEWNHESLEMRLTALYAPADDGSIVALWLVSSGDASNMEFEERIMEVLPHFRSTLGLAEADSYAGIVNGHRLSFDLRFSGEGEQRTGDEVEHAPIELSPVDVLPGNDAEFFDAIMEVNPQFDGGVVHRWEDAERGVSLSYQVIAHDLGFGPESPFVNWMAGQFTRFYRIHEDTGDFPIDLIHLEDVKTHVISPEEEKRHFANNTRAPEAGVILQVYLPRSPYAHVRDVSFHVEDTVEEEVPEPAPPAAPGVSGPAPHPAGGPHLGTPSSAGASDAPGAQAGKFGHGRILELRQYRRSRSETITRIALVMLIARASTREDLDLMERELNLSTVPLYRRLGVLSGHASGAAKR